MTRHSQRKRQRLSAPLLGLVLVLASPAALAGTITYYIPDAQGSPIAATDAQGTILWREHYAPYGEKLNEACVPPCAELTDYEDIGYTGHEYDAETGLTYMQARYYDPVVGRFLSIDPVGFDPAAPMTFNRYSYANNNPYKYIDPDGRCSAASTTRTCIASQVAPATNRTSVVSSVTEAAAEASKSDYMISGTKEALGSINESADGSQKAELLSDVSHSITANANKATAKLPSNAVAIIHGHPPHSGLKDESRTMGDALALATSGKPNIAVSADGRMAAHELENGVYQVRALDGAFTRDEIRHFREEVDARQEVFNSLEKEE